VVTHNFYSMFVVDERALVLGLFEESCDFKIRIEVMRVQLEHTLKQSESLSLGLGSA